MRAPSIETQTIKLPAKTKKFFGHTGTLLPDYKGNPLQYTDLIGDNPSITAKQAEQLSEHNTISFTNTSAGETDAIADLVTFLFLELDNKQHIQDPALISRSYCTNTSTMPIEVAITDDYEQYHFYVKQPCTNRIIGKYLYNLITGGDYSFRFNEHIFVEEKIPGKTADCFAERELTSKDEYLTGVIRANIHSYLLGLDTDMYHPQNRIITDNWQTILFDFNILFSPSQTPQPSLDFCSSKPLSENYIQDIHENEIATIRKRLKTQRDILSSFEHAVAELYDHSYMTINKRISRYYGSDSLTDYLYSRLDHCQEIYRTKKQ
jgi:hypothetical protein